MTVLISSLASVLLHGCELVLDRLALALDVGHDADACLVRRDEARLRAGLQRVDDVAEGRNLLAAHGGLDVRHGGDDALDRGRDGAVVERARIARDDEVEELGRVLGAAGVENVVGVGGLVLRAVII